MIQDAGCGLYSALRVPIQCFAVTAVALHVVCPLFLLRASKGLSFRQLHARKQPFTGLGLGRSASTSGSASSR